MTRTLDRSRSRNRIIAAFVCGVAVGWPLCASAATGIEGYIRLSPTCPVERMPPDPRCAPRPYQTTIEIHQGQTVVETISSDANGYFRATLSPGSYTLRANPGQMLPRCLAQTVIVPASELARLEIECDTGIR
jgi:hypothetical protein